MNGINGIARAAEPASIAPRILDEAADWLMQLNDSAVSDADRAAFERWRQSHPAHAQAWCRAEQLMQKFGGLPASLAMPALNRPLRARGPTRRAAVTKLAALLAVAPAGWAAWQMASRSGWTADYRTATGESRDVSLADGTLLTLSTASAVDVRFDATQRFIHLRAGEIWVQTAPDPSSPYRPFRVGTAQGQMQALGTRFSVRQQEGRTQLAVLESAVRIEPRNAASQLVPAGQQITFTDSSVAEMLPVDESAVAWRHGMLLADKLRLADFCAELDRWRSGFLRVDPAVADVRISGAFPLAEPERALRMLVSTYPLEAVTRLRGYWLTLVPR
ncbi:FecR domain-containing protein [Variovorax sp. HJSM1_2]|uniref:FecR domain-containing protein n=1 Tax=Variovorax sp. HJSM1_2 TaxID=3366263 RepID=UPI003BDCD8CB